MLAAAHWHQGEMLSLERLDGVWSAQRRKFNLSSHPVCPKPGAHVPAHSVQTMGAFCSTLGAAPVHSVEQLILYSPFFPGPSHWKTFLGLLVSLFLAVSWRAKLQRLSLRSQYLLGQTVPGSVVGSASFQHRDIFVAGGNLFACRCEVLVHLPSR